MHCASCSIPTMAGGAVSPNKSKKCTCKDKKCKTKMSLEKNKNEGNPSKKQIKKTK